MSLSKRIFDVAFSVGALLFFLPFALAIALLIKLSSKGPIFYSCTRVGREGKSIQCWKFRTMCLDADVRLAQVLASDETLREEWETFFKLKNDPRIDTKIGNFLRKTSLDELPQFWNVLKGDLSVVGPRPVTLYEVEKYYGAKASRILSIRPGITGMWQTSGRNLLSFEERVKLEENYVGQQSLLLDLKIIFKTIPMLIHSRGAF